MSLPESKPSNFCAIKGWFLQTCLGKLGLRSNFGCSLADDLFGATFKSNLNIEAPKWGHKLLFLNVSGLTSFVPGWVCACYEGYGTLCWQTQTSNCLESQCVTQHAQTRLKPGLNYCDLTVQIFNIQLLIKSTEWYCFFFILVLLYDTWSCRILWIPIWKPGESVLLSYTITARAKDKFRT